MSNDTSLTIYDRLAAGEFNPEQYGVYYPTTGTKKNDAYRQRVPRIARSRTS